ncbi:MAG TPA: molybdenum cofactor biosynthesis protein MoaE [Terriglobales bacterium]|nr:molybdenum cofactor biosynthesis protein MoaE [Terriglobales bacterium]
MRIRAVLFAGLAQRLGVREEWLELPGSPTAADVFRHYRAREPQLGELGRSLLLAVNAEFSAPETPLHEGDEVALLPPMSGGAPEAKPGGAPQPGSDSTVIETALVREPLPPPPAPDTHGGHGAVVSFEGVTRNHSRGREVVALEYEAYEPMARARLAAIATEAAARWPLLSIRILHRLGTLRVGESSVQIVVAAAHRGPAFEACRFLIDTLKQSVPIWKKEHFRDGCAWADGEFPQDQPQP